jgi:pimeloyl-ACP methyl ester carboxylesterase
MVAVRSQQSIRFHAMTFAAAAFGLLIATIAHAQTPVSVADTWTGGIETPAGRLAIVVRLQQGDNGTWSGTIDIPQQGAKAVPLTEVTVKAADVSFKIAGPPGDPTIRLTLSADGARMSGTLTQGGGSVPVSLARGDTPPAPPAAPKRPQTPAPPFPYLEEQVSYRNEAANVQLAGTLTRPRSSGRVPAVLLITGSGQQDRDETLFDHKPFHVWADHLTRQGIAVLRVDDRGVGGSSRGPQAVTSSDFADDVRAGVAFLQKRSDIDPKRIGLIGHSEGAMLAAMVAATSPDIAFIVMLAGPGLPGDQILLAQAAMLFRAQGATDATIAWDRSVRERVFAVLKAETDGKPDQARRQALLDEIGAAKPAGPGLPDGAAARPLAEALLKAGSDPWLRFFLAFDPRPTLTKVRCPVLAVGGERDVQVGPRDNLPAIERAIRAGGNRDVTVVTMPGLNHLFQTSTSGMPSEYATIEETISPAVLKLVADWIAKQAS